MRITIFALFCFLTVSVLFSQPLNPISVNIPMRDGKYLAADVYLPDNEIARPTILIQTPYNKFYYRFSLPLGIGTNISSSPYNFVIVDWRGFYGSGSAAVSQPDRGKDGYDVIDWIVQQEWSNSKVGTWGPSALGKIQYQTAKEQHPAHICAVPLVASPEFLYQTYYPNGVYRKEYLDQLDALGFGLSGIVLANPHYNLTWYYAENFNFYPQQIKIPMLLIGGWYDHNIFEMVKYFNDLRTLSDPSVRNKHKFLIGPWAHGGFGMAQVGTAQQGELYFYEAAGYSDLKARQFLDYYLLDAENNWEANPDYLYFQMGDMQWLESDVWPPQNLVERKFYLKQGGELSSNISVETASFSEYFYDPRDPSPTIGGATLRNDLLQGPYDQAPIVESRNDILIFTSEVLSTPIVHKGKPQVKLFVSSDKLDTDFCIRLCDVYPDNRSMLLNDNIFRMRFRNGFTINDTVFMNPGEIYEINVSLPDLAHTFLPGHRIRLDITSSNYPRYDNNLNNAGTMYVAGDTLVALNKIYHQADKASFIKFSVYESSVKIQEQFKVSENLNIYPNPASNGELVTINLNECVNEISVKTIFGQEILNISALSQIQLNTATLKPGIYIVEVETENQRTIRYKLIIK